MNNNMNNNTHIPVSTMRLDPGQDRAIAGRVINDAITRNRQDERYLSYHYPRTADEWWNVVDTWWDELLTLVSSAYDLGKPRDVMQSLEACGVEVERMRKARSVELAHVFEEVWGRAADHASIHARKAWDVLCDLCSECYVLSEEGEEV
jgi:hypothetical protein